MKNLGYDITESSDVVNLGFCDTKYLQKVSNSDLDMDQHRIKNCLHPIVSKDLSTKYYTDTEITKIQHNLNLSPFLRKNGQRAMTVDLNMNGNNIISLKSPSYDTDGVNKLY